MGEGVGWWVGCNVERQRVEDLRKEKENAIEQFLVNVWMGGWEAGGLVGWLVGWLGC